ncbi:hypothetical protein [Halobacterium wangiae]|uniref:hypothetical protein n=1 Tax=Halobacterium wangiae TaxID=2902623 RepID=UPI001E627145|nr:hypothetical protein [Halobacterium wangiae]
MNSTNAVVVGLVLALVVGSVGVAPAAATGENPACDSPSQGFEKSFEASDGTSLERAGPGVVNARTKIGCEQVTPS